MSLSGDDAVVGAEHRPAFASLIVRALLPRLRKRSGKHAPLRAAALAWIGRLDAREIAPLIREVVQPLEPPPPADASTSGGSSWSDALLLTASCGPGSETSAALWWDLAASERRAHLERRSRGHDVAPQAGFLQDTAAAEDASSWANTSGRHATRSPRARRRCFASRRGCARRRRRRGRRRPSCSRRRTDTRPGWSRGLFLLLLPLPSRRRRRRRRFAPWRLASWRRSSPATPPSASRPGTGPSRAARSRRWRRGSRRRRRAPRNAAGARRRRRAGGRRTTRDAPPARGGASLSAEKREEEAEAAEVSKGVAKKEAELSAGVRTDDAATEPRPRGSCRRRGAPSARPPRPRDARRRARRGRAVSGPGGGRRRRRGRARDRGARDDEDAHVSARLLRRTAPGLLAALQSALAARANPDANARALSALWLGARL